MSWTLYALLGAVAAAATAILAKIGVSGVPSNLAVLIRTAVVLLLTAGIVFARNEFVPLKQLKPTAWAALLLSGVATGISWLAYFKALQLAPVSSVAPLDKLSLPLTVILAALIFGEAVTWRSGLGVALMVVGAILATKP